MSGFFAFCVRSCSVLCCVLFVLGDRIRSCLVLVCVGVCVRVAVCVE